jgi:hypothetical protein
VRCSKGTPIIKKPNPSLLSKEEQRKKKKNKSVFTILDVGYKKKQKQTPWL